MKWMRGFTGGVGLTVVLAVVAGCSSTDAPSPAAAALVGNDGGSEGARDGATSAFEGGPREASNEAGAGHDANVWTDAEGGVGAAEASVDAAPDGAGDAGRLAGKVLLIGDPPIDHLVSPLGLAVDATSLYWSEAAATNGAILRGPRTLGEGPDSGASAVSVLATSNDGMPADIALDDTTVFWASAHADGTSTLARVAKAGGAAATLATIPAPSTGAAPNVTFLAVDDTSLYWTELDRVMKAPKAGGAPTVLAASPGTNASLVLGGDRVYWLSLGDREVAGRVEFAPRTVAAGGGVATVAAANPGANCNPSFPAHQLAADAGNVYWSIASGVLKIPLDGGPTTLLAGASVDVPASFCATVAVDASGLYLATSYLVQASLAGGPPVSVYPFNYQPPFMLGVIEGVVFWPIYAVRGVHGGAIARIETR